MAVKERLPRRARPENISISAAAALFPFQLHVPRRALVSKEPPACGTAIAQEEDLLRQIGLSHCVEHLRNGRLADWCKELSTGEQKRLSLTRAILHQLPWLFLDEPFSGIEDKSRIKCSALLHMALPGTTIVCWGHGPEGNGLHFKRHIAHKARKPDCTVQRNSRLEWAT